jgi:dihydroorotate dehydrogenase
MYQVLFSKLIGYFEPETAHRYALRLLAYAHALGITKRIYPTPLARCEVMGLSFLNHIGLAAGLDKNGDYIDALGELGFGFIEVGTVTPLPQSGNPAPRLFRLPEQQAIINRMGFNNKGCEYLVNNLRKIKYTGILGVNIGKNVTTPISEAVPDYVYCFQQVAFYASYVTLNISSPNTVALRTLQQQDTLRELLQAVKTAQGVFARQFNKYVPVVLKISPDLHAHEIVTMAEVLLEQKIDGVIATNTTLRRDGVESAPHGKEPGGLSGKPLRHTSTLSVRHLYQLLGNQIPIIASGGVMDAESAAEKINAGAKLVQLYSGLIYEGPGLIQEISQGLERRAKL